MDTDQLVDIELLFYNALPTESVELLIKCMKEFELNQE